MTKNYKNKNEQQNMNEQKQNNSETNSASRGSRKLSEDSKKPVTLFGLAKQYFSVYKSAREMKSSVIKDVLGDGKIAKVVNLLPISKVVSVGVGAFALLFLSKPKKTA